MLGLLQGTARSVTPTPRTGLDGVSETLQDSMHTEYHGRKVLKGSQNPKAPPSGLAQNSVPESPCSRLHSLLLNSY